MLWCCVLCVVCCVLCVVCCVVCVVCMRVLWGRYDTHVHELHIGLGARRLVEDLDGNGDLHCLTLGNPDPLAKTQEKKEEEEKEEE